MAPFTGVCTIVPVLTIFKGRCKALRHKLEAMIPASRTGSASAFFRRTANLYPVWAFANEQQHYYAGHPAALLFDDVTKLGKYEYILESIASETSDIEHAPTASTASDTVYSTPPLLTCASTVSDNVYSTPRTFSGTPRTSAAFAPGPRLGLAAAANGETPAPAQAPAAVVSAAHFAPRPPAWGAGASGSGAPAAGGKARVPSRPWMAPYPAVKVRVPRLAPALQLNIARLSVDDLKAACIGCLDPSRIRADPCGQYAATLRMISSVARTDEHAWEDYLQSKQLWIDLGQSPVRERFGMSLAQVQSAYLSFAVRSLLVTQVRTFQAGPTNMLQLSGMSARTTSAYICGALRAVKMLHNKHWH